MDLLTCHEGRVTISPVLSTFLVGGNWRKPTTFSRGLGFMLRSVKPNWVGSTKGALHSAIHRIVIFSIFLNMFSKSKNLDRSSVFSSS